MKFNKKNYSRDAAADAHTTKIQRLSTSELASTIILVLLFSGWKAWKIEPLKFAPAPTQPHADKLVNNSRFQMLYTSSDTRSNTMRAIEQAAVSYSAALSTQ